MKKWLPYILIIVLGAALLVLRTCKNSNKRNTKDHTTSNTVNRDHGFDRRTSYLEYSNHANCRMECRHITKGEVEDIMQDGTINYNKSDLQNARCPRYALEGKTRDGQHVRIIFAQCNEKTEVVTVIDLETEWECHCPGDDDKYINKRP
jgi:hypothetical protein